MANFNFNDLINIVTTKAEAYETSLSELQNDAAGGASLDISDATVATTRIQVNQSLLEMATGIAKSATDHTKKIGKSVGS